MNHTQPMSDLDFWNHHKTVRRGRFVCWEFLGAKQHGYGALSIKGRMVGAHRHAYTLAFGPIPPEKGIA